MVTRALGTSKGLLSGPSPSPAILADQDRERAALPKIDEAKLSQPLFARRNQHHARRA